MNRGFSLVELILAVFLVAMIMAGLASFQGGISRDKGRLVQDITVQNQADFARKAILRELNGATLLQWPPPPGVTGSNCTELVGWRNLKKADAGTNSIIQCGSDCTTVCRPMCYGGGGLSPCIPANQNWMSLIDGLNPAGTVNKYNFGDDVYYFRFCLTAAKQLYYYHGPGYVVPNGGCGSPGIVGTDHGTELLAGDPPGTVTVTAGGGGIFNRPARQDNYVKVSFTVEHNGRKTLEKTSAVVDTGVELLGSAQ